MSRAPLDVRLKGGSDLRRISKDLRRLGGPALRRQFAKDLRAAAKPVLPTVRAAARAIPVKGPAASGLRSRLAKAATLKVRTTGKYAGVSIRIDANKMPTGEKALPFLMEGEGRWRHPVFGNTEVWVQQKPHPYFYRTVNRAVPQIRRQIEKSLDNIAKELTK